MGFYRSRTSAGIPCNDTVDIDRGELELILEGLRVWREIKRGKNVPLAQERELWRELEAIWEAKKSYRENLKVRRAEESARMREAFRRKEHHEGQE